MKSDLNYPRGMNEAATAPPVGLLLGNEPSAQSQRGEDPFGPHRGPLTVTDDFSVLDDPVELNDFTEFKEIDGQTVAESVLMVQGMYCAACADTVECALQGLPGVHSAQVHAATRRLTLRWDPARTRMSELAQIVGRTGYRLLPMQQAMSISERLRETRQMLWRLFVAGFCMMQVMMYAWPAYVAQPGDLTAEMEHLLRWASWVITLPMVVFSKVRLGVSPDINALATLMVVTVGLGVIIAGIILNRAEARRLADERMAYRSND